MNQDQFKNYNHEISMLSDVLELINYRSVTISNYIRCISECCQWLDFNCNKSISDASFIELRRFLLYLKNVRNYKPRTINVYNCAIKKYFQYVLFKPLNNNELPLAKVDICLPKVPTRLEVFRIIYETQNLKHQAMLAVAFGAALRIGEVVKLRFKDISFTNMTLSVSAEVSKNRYAGTVELPVRLKELLYKYWQVYCKGMKPNDWLFPGQKTGTHISKGSVGRMFHRRLSELGLDDRGYTFHSMRHAHALFYYQAGADLFQVKERLRHRSISSTLIYVQLDGSLHGRKEIENPFDVLSFQD